MKYTLNSKNASHISDIIKKYFKLDMSIHLKSNYTDCISYFISVGSEVKIFKNEILLIVYYYGNNGLKSADFHIPFGSKIEMKGSLINISMKKPNYMRNILLSFSYTNLINCIFKTKSIPWSFELEAIYKEALSRFLAMEKHSY